LIFIDSVGLILVSAGGFFRFSIGFYLDIVGQFISVSDVLCPDQVLVVIPTFFTIYPEHAVFNVTDQGVHLCKAVWFHHCDLLFPDFTNHTYNLGLPKEYN